MEEIEVELRKQAQILGNLNLELNKFIEQNQQTSLEIAKLEQRISKKKKLIDQQSKDKAIIQQKLVKAEERKKNLEIEAGNDQKITKQEETPVEQQIKRPQFLNKIQKKDEKEERKQIKKQIKQAQQQEGYNSSDKGGYEPPNLFADQAGLGSGSDSDENQQEDENVLQSVRQKLQNLNKAGEQDEDDE